MIVRTEIGHWALVPSWVRKALRGQSRALELNVLLADVAEHDDGVAQHRRGWLAKEMDCSPDTVDRAVGVLVRVGAVSVERRFDDDGGSLASNYLVHQVPPPAAADEGGRTDAAPPDGAADAEPDPGGGRTNAEGGPQERGEVAAPPRGGRRATAAHSYQPPIYQPPSNQPSLSPPAADDANGAGNEGGNLPLTTDSEDAFKLATLIRDRFQAHADRVGLGVQVRITTASVRDADLLLRRGPLPADENDRVFTPEPVPYEKAARLVDYVFDHPERENGSFAWADQIRSGGALRKHWHKLATWANNHRQAAKTTPGGVRPAAMVPDGLADLTDSQIVELIRAEPSGDDLARIAAEIVARLEPAGPDQGERVASFRALLGGKNWPRGAGGQVNKLRFRLGAWCDEWLRANQAGEQLPALSRGA